MKLANKLIETLNSSDLKSLRNDIINSYTQEEMEEFETFQDFFDAEDVRQAYEDEWEEQKDYWAPYLETIWNEYKSGKLKFN